MGLKMDKQSREKLLNALRPEYQQASAKRKRELLKALLESTGYSKKHAITLLNAEQSDSRPPRRSRPKVYDEEVLLALTTIWKASNLLCSKRLAPFMAEFIGVLERKGHFSVEPHVRQKLLTISASTMDRLLAKERSKLGRSPSLTRAGNFLKSQIPIRTFTEWNEQSPGFFEADLVAHSGSDPRGQFLQTLTLTDVCTQWTECLGLIRRGEEEVIDALNTHLPYMPFPIRGLDTDNGSEFINYKLLDWCSVRQVTFTRSRQYKSNDQAHVEERNGSVVRRLVGYERLEGLEAYSALRELYAHARLYINFFQPSAKLIVKHRSGAKVYRRYDIAKTPFQRILASNCINEESKEMLQRQYEQLDPVLLLGSIRELQNRLSSLSSSSVAPPQKRIANQRRHTQRVHVERQDGQSLRSLVLNLTPGTIFKVVDLLPYASRGNADATANRMVRNGELLRISRGVYKTTEQTIMPDDGTNLHEATVH